MTASTKSKGQEIAADVASLLRARNPLIWITTREESRVERLLIEACASAKYAPVFWDVAAGVTRANGEQAGIGGSADPGDTLTAIRENASTGGSGRTVWIMRDLPVWFGGGIQGASTLRALRNLTRYLPGVPRDNAQSVVILSPSADVPPELSSVATVVDWPLPDKQEIASILDAAIASLPDDMRTSAAPNGTRDAAIDAAMGLSSDEAAACYAKSLVSTRKIEPGIVAGEKKRVIAREKVLEWFDPLPGGLAAVGGLDNLKDWLITRSAAYTPAAREYGLPSPRGVMLVGVSGCGKTHTARAIATNWQCPLLKCDLGALKDKFVGASEAKLRTMLRTVEAVGRCVLFFDEIEKSLSGAVNGGADGGASSDQLGTLLQWMNDRTGDAFVVMTANDISGLPPEFLRKGRFDEIFFVDLPTTSERAAILTAALAKYGRTASGIDVVRVANETPQFTGAEMAAIVPDAMFAAFNDGARAIFTDDLLLAARTVTPLATTAKEKIAALKAWASTRARAASKPETAADVNHSRRIDL